MKNPHLALATLGIGLTLSGTVMAAEPQPPMALDSPGTWITTDDYPEQALLEEVEGVVRFLVDVDRRGEPAKCTVTVSSGSDQLDARACNLIMTRARFSPATDRRGRPVAGSYANSVRWAIPKFPPPQGPGVSVTSYVVEADGLVTDCKVETATGAMAGVLLVGPTACPQRAFNEGYVDAAGEPVRKRVRTITRIEVVKP